MSKESAVTDKCETCGHEPDHHAKDCGAECHHAECYVTGCACKRYVRAPAAKEPASDVLNEPLVINHEEAVSFAHFRHDTSNLARCYLALTALLAARDARIAGLEADKLKLLDVNEFKTRETIEFLGLLTDTRIALLDHGDARYIAPIVDRIDVLLASKAGERPA